MGNIVMKGDSSERGEIVVYQPDEVLKVDVFINDETVWLTQEQIAQIFSVGRPAITKHIRNIYKCGELEENSTCSILEHMGNAGQQAYQVKYFNLDMILSVGYRVNSKSAICFRRWASNILKEYMLRGYSANQRLIDLEGRVNAKLLEHELRLDEYGKKIDFFVRTSLPPVEGVFYDGQIFDAYVFATDLIRSARRSVILIDNYVDKEVYHIGASLKDLGKKLFAFSKLSFPKELLP